MKQSETGSLAAALSKLSAASEYDRGVLDVLTLLGLVQIKNRQAVPADAVAGMILDSLRTHLIDGVAVGLHWSDLDGEGVRGVDILRAIEASRMARVPQPTPARIVQAVQAVIKTRRVQRSSFRDLYLMQYDSHADRYQPIGGKREPDDGNVEETLRREMVEELRLGDVPKCTLTSLGAGWKETTLSATYGILTQYTFSFYRVSDIDFSIEVDNITRWLTRAEILAERADDGRPISPIYQQALGWELLDALAPVKLL
ncbi:MAG: NUDIX domain-containing protein [Anaerolineae bacterium]|nr:NUDIX domain-containing protein [Anaerolineae bacterium]